MSTPRDLPSRARARARVVRVVSLGLVVVAGGGLVGLSPLSDLSAGAATATESTTTVAWRDDQSAAKSFQPARDTASPHYTEFDELAVTVSQTEGIIDQTVRVTVTGFAGTRSSSNFGQNVMNYVQAMQCWGEDPTAENFRETCQWGGRFAPNNGVGGSIVGDNLLRISTIDADIFSPTSADNPFRTAQGRVVSAKPYSDPDGAGPLPLTEGYSILDYFNPATTNEVSSARIGADGSGFFDFETQTADQAPQLGCGTAEVRRCWLVVVPRGTVFGGVNAGCSTLIDPANNDEPYTYGRPNSIQGGSPINPDCDYWNNRVVVPLDFTPVGNSCEIGGTEQRVIGSQLMVGAMSSWQPALCRDLKTTYSFSANPDSIARRQLLEGTADVGFVGAPLNAGELESNEERQLLAETSLVYAPVAVSGVTLSFVAEFDQGRVAELTLSPRLVAKLLTQSYQFTVPWNEADPEKNFAHLPEVNRRYLYLNQDPEFQQLNPANYTRFTQNPAIVLPGPAGADAIRQVWRWILADADAVSFLNGAPDQAGMTVNPYYLPRGAPGAQVPTFDESGAAVLSGGKPVMKPVGLTNLDGSPMKLSESSIDTFIKADQSKVPLKLNNEKSRFDSIQFAPYTDDLLTAARQAFRANPNSRTIWDATKINAAGETGDWVSSGPQPQGAKFMIAITDSPSAYRYGLTSAKVLPANSSASATADSVSFTAALEALRPTSLDSITQVDPAAVVGAGYPLTTVTYAAVNLSTSDAAGRAAIAGLLRQVTTTGQIPGTSTGQLPIGYVPLSPDMVIQARAAVEAIVRYVPLPEGSGAPAPASNGIAQDSYYSAGSVVADDGTLADQTTGLDTAVTTDDSPESPGGRTGSSDGATLARTGLAASLGLGVLGSIFGPVLFRGRGFV